MNFDSKSFCGISEIVNGLKRPSYDSHNIQVIWKYILMIF